MNRLPVLVVAAMVALSAPSYATWSIILVNPTTREVAVGGATCLQQLGLKKLLAAVRVGAGAGVTQALLDDGSNRSLIGAELAKGTPPAQILALIQTLDPGFQKRQIGIVDMSGGKVTFTGNQTAAWAGGVTGIVGDIHYAIQGNILTGAPVVALAEAAVVNTPGDVAEKLMAAMEAARSMGGDGRCSCSNQNPTGCGSPPPSFNKSAHIGFMVVSRIGDVDGTCTDGGGCANGAYYLDLNVKGTDGMANDPDPVIQLTGLFAAWRQSWIGRPDHIASQADVDADLVRADATSSTTLRVRLIDWQGHDVGHGGATLAIAHEPGSAGATSAGTVVDHGDGTYSIPLTSTGVAGVDTLRVTVDDGQGDVVLYPFVELGAVQVPTLSAHGGGTISTTAGDDVMLSIDAGPALAERPYLVLCSMSGSTPGFALDGTHVPLAFDAAVAWSYALCGQLPFIQGCGVLDEFGRAQPGLALDPLDLRPSIGKTLTFSFVTLDPIDWAADAVDVQIAP
ncbi:MAG: DUF1028 domain-containing protein [Planctomycetes bacterium]|nr:DUF1028 domain-containing protein [Planctomycetota bacterium]MCC7173362.1 DUF1028 domain-containing protein [Planctomycetota bacterium]